jgi:tRNA modification GTPase
MDLDDTIAAIASAPGGALRGIVRLSGPRALECVASLVPSSAESPASNCQYSTCTPAMLRLPPPLGEVPAIVYLWPTTRSYTRQPSAELHLPGSPPILEAALAAVCLAGARLARPGEYTLRAFLAGRLDLTQAEAVLGVIDSQSQAELTAARAPRAGGLARPLGLLREQLLDLLAHLEAGLDFVDEDIDFISPGALKNQLTEAAAAVCDLASRLRARGEAGRLPRVVLVGLPNAGKSSLLNALAGQSAAIVSEVAGTTRDFVEKRVKLQDREVLLVDTAGISAAAGDGIHAAAQQASQEQARQADLTLLCVDYSAPSSGRHGQQAASGAGPCLIVATKCDLRDAGSFTPERAIPTSSRTGLGLVELKRAMEVALDHAPAESSVVAATADRCRESLRLAAAALDRALDAAQRSAGDELIAAEVRSSLEELGQVVGAVYTDDLLDRIFSRFCIGK